jgi:hypothetical protein
MALVFTNPADVVNAALDRVGYKKNIGNLYDGSPQAAAALAVYGQTRDELLRNFDWGFAERDLDLTLLKTAPVGGYTAAQPWTKATDPIPPWIYEYEYPDFPGDMLKLRSLRGSDVIPEYDPQAVEYRIANDNSYTPAKKVILTNKASAIAVYTGQVTDPTQWEPGFTEALVAQLGRRLAPVLVGLEAVKVLEPDEAMTTQVAEMKVG